MEQKQLSANYLPAVKAIKHAILESRYRAARLVNKEMLALYYWVGNYVSVHSRVDACNTHAIAVISKMLQQELPGLTGFSETNIKNMRTFYETWCPVLNRQLSAADLDNNLNISELLNRQITSADLSEEDYKSFLSVGFSIHREIIRKTSTLEERLFYIRLSAKEFWTYDKAKYHLNENLYKKQGTIQQTNFARTITDADFKQRALQSFKDEYMLDFINIEDTEMVDEREIEQTIVLNVKNFIMAFGQDFSFIGNQYGVATYRTSKDLPERLRNALPDIEELKKLMN